MKSKKEKERKRNGLRVLTAYLFTSRNMLSRLRKFKRELLRERLKLTQKMQNKKGAVLLAKLES